MNDSTHFFRLRLHLASGRVASFEQSEEELIRHNLPSIAPDSVFQNPVLIIAGRNRTTSFRTERICRIEVDTSEKIMWTFARQLDECELLDAATFETEHAAQKDRPREEKRIAGKRFQELVEIRDVCAETFHIRIAGVVQPSAARVHVTESIVEASYIYARRNHTHVLFNPKNVTSVALFPGPREVPYDALKAHHID